MRTTYTRDKCNWMTIVRIAIEKQLRTIKLSTEERKAAALWAMHRADLHSSVIDNSFTWDFHGTKVRVHVMPDHMSLEVAS
jgi:hypothetical protein